MERKQVSYSIYYRTVGVLGLLAAAACCLALSPVATPPARPWPSSACASCHKVDPAFSHPTGVAPRQPTPAHPPLENGRVECTTCHLADQESHALAKRTHDGMLREPVDPAGLCAECHGAASRDRTTMHALMGQAHLRWPGIKQTSPSVPTGSLDLQSRSCLGCHDGTVATSVGAEVADPSGRHSKGHPVGVRYGRAGRGLAPASMLDARIRLFDGNVGCGSCHSPYSREPSLLVMSNDRSAMCLSCHRDR